MKVKPVFVVNSILAFLFGIGFMVIPAFLLNMIGFSKMWSDQTNHLIYL